MKVKSNVTQAMPSIQNVLIDKIEVVLTDGFRALKEPRRDEIIGECLKAMRAGFDIGALTVFYDIVEKKYWLADGYFRLWAFLKWLKELELKDGVTVPTAIRCQVFSGGSQDAKLYALTTANHMTPLTSDDIDKRVRMLLLEPETLKWNFSELARRACVGRKVVFRVRKEILELEKTAPNEIHADPETRKLIVRRLMNESEIPVLINRNGVIQTQRRGSIGKAHPVFSDDFRVVSLKTVKEAQGLKGEVRAILFEKNRDSESLMKSDHVHLLIPKSSIDHKLVNYLRAVGNCLGWIGCFDGIKELLERKERVYRKERLAGNYKSADDAPIAAPARKSSSAKPRRPKNLVPRRKVGKGTKRAG